MNFSKDDIEILNQIRALSFTPGAYGLIKNKKLKLLEATYPKRTCKTANGNFRVARQSFCDFFARRRFIGFKITNGRKTSHAG